MHKCLLIIDYQQGFITDVTQHLGAKLVELILSGEYEHICASVFQNTQNSPFVTLMGWDGCMTEESAGLPPLIEDSAELIIKKHGYTCLTTEFLNYLHRNHISEVHLCGVDTDCCVLKTAVDLFEMQIRPVVLSNYCYSSGDLKSHEAGLTVLQRLIGENNIR